MPRVWWHWMNGNVTEVGIQKDLEWMHRVGVHGVTIFEGSLNTPQVVSKRLVFMTPEWKDALRFALNTARRLGIEVGIASSPGWSETGGPWVPPSHGMKKMVWSATRVTSTGQPLTVHLPQPPDVAGVFQDRTIPPDPDFPEMGRDLPRFYADSALIAYRVPRDAASSAEGHPEITASEGAVNVPLLSDGKIDQPALTLPGDHAGWLQFHFSHSQLVQSLTFASTDDTADLFGYDEAEHLPHILLQASDDGVHFRVITAVLPTTVPQRTVSFAPVSAEFFRLTFPETRSEHGGDHPPRQITEAVLHREARVHLFEQKAGFATAPDYYAIPSSPADADSAVPTTDVLRLDGRMKSDGTLTWTPPPGEWIVLRMGYSLTGKQNGPAPREATGLEVDKLNRTYVKSYVDTYLERYSHAIGAAHMGAGGIRYLLTDSTEVGPQNWTDHILDEFQRRRGYAPHPWLPALTGVIVQSASASDGFLWDFRETLAELVAEKHYGTVADEAHRYGLLDYGEAFEYRRPSLGDDEDMRSHTDVPMGAIWTPNPDQTTEDPSYVADVRGAASVAHIYGQNVVAAESMTSNEPPWRFSPVTLKPTADLEMALGVNRFMLHESTHQPLLDKVPGLTLGRYGQWFNRNDTWAEQAGPWITYLGRASFLLQQGHECADVAYFYGEEGPLTSVFGFQPPADYPEGYGTDFVNASVILHQLSFHDGLLRTTGGASYSVLYLGRRTNRMTLPVLRRIAQLLAQGATVVGDRPQGSPSNADDDREFQSLADSMWGKERPSGSNYRPYGKGRLYSGQNLASVFATRNLPPDVESTTVGSTSKILSLHRRMPGADIYFLNSRSDRAERANVILRVHGKIPELWHPDSGTTEQVSYRMENGRTTIPLSLKPRDAIFLVFRRPATAASFLVPEKQEETITKLEHAWQVSFQPNRGAPAAIHMDHLASLSENGDPGIRYFSGTATYVTTLQADPSWFRPGEQLWLDLGDVRNIADVQVNDAKLGTVWCEPFRADITPALHPGRNILSIRVTDLWVNRLIGDEQPGIAQRYTFTDIQAYRKDSPLVPSGLLGPVHLLRVFASPEASRNSTGSDLE